MLITHSVKGNNRYELKLHGEKVASATRVHGGFDHGGRFWPTMKGLKEMLWGGLTEAQRRPPEKVKKLTLGQAYKLACLSHTGAYIYLKEARKTWPEFRVDQIAAYIVRKHHEAIAQWPWPQAADSKKWLEANPELGRYDQGEENRRLEVIYGEGSTEAGWENPCWEPSL